MLAPGSSPKPRTRLVLQWKPISCEWTRGLGREAGMIWDRPHPHPPRSCPWYQGRELRWAGQELEVCLSPAAPPRALSL